MSLHSIVRDVRKSFTSLSRRSFKNGGKSHGPVDEPQEQIKQQPELHQNSRWATLPPEILLNVIKRLDESDDSTSWPAKKHVEACAAVCKSWRMMCKGRPEFCGKTTFLVSLKQPACPGETFQCYIKRDKANMTFHLFISLSPPVLPVENGKFILSAKGTHRGTHTEYIISSDANNISCSSSSYVGKIRSNFIRNKFIIYDSQPQPSCTHHIPPTTSSSAHRFLSKKISPKVPTGSYNIAQVTYKVNLTGVIQPRKMNCIMHSIPASALDVGDSRVAGQTPLKQPRNLENSFKNLSLSKSVDCPTDYSNKSKPLVLKNKQPRWHEGLQCWCLNFHGRVHVASVKNFQLIDARDPADIGAHVYLQFGRVSKDKETFTMDYKYPLSAFQAFAICLSSFSNKLLCDH